MILHIPKVTPWMTETGFKHKVQAGAKIHSLITGFRWKQGMKIEFIEGDISTIPIPFTLPYKDVASKWTTEKNKDGELIDYPVCCAIEDFKIWITKMKVGDPDFVKNVSYQFEIKFKIGSIYFDTEELFDLIAMNDGFDSREDFLQWFIESAKKKMTNYLEGQVIHWTTNVYDSSTAKVMYV